MSIEQFTDKISRYDYLLLANPSKEFLDHFAESLNIEYSENQPMLFKIVGSKKLKLEKIP
jgi:hypothetical protein